MPTSRRTNTTASLPDDLACQEFVELVTSYLEGRLAPAERARIDVHLANCPVCTEYLAQMRQTLRLLGRLPEDTIPLDARNRLLSIFRDWKRESSSAP